MHSIRRSGIFASLVALAIVAGCGVRYGFAGGGLPDHIRTMAVLPLENETQSSELQGELHEVMRQELQRRLGVRDATEARADAVVRGIIRTYDPDVPVAFSANPNQSASAIRRLTVTIDIEVVDQTTGRVLLQRRGLSAQKDYAERGEPDARRQALRLLVDQIIEGAQSQW